MARGSRAQQGGPKGKRRPHTQYCHGEGQHRQGLRQGLLVLLFPATWGMPHQPRHQKESIPTVRGFAW